MIQAFRRSPYDREIVRIGLPALGALAADPLVSLVDTAFIGRLGAVALAAVAIASAIYAAVFAVFNFLEYATTSLVAAAVGSGDRDAAGRSSAVALVVALGGGVLVTAALLGLTGYVAYLFPLIIVYGGWRAWSKPAGPGRNPASRARGRLSGEPKQPPGFSVLAGTPWASIPSSAGTRG